MFLSGGDKRFLKRKYNTSYIEKINPKIITGFRMGKARGVVTGVVLGTILGAAGTAISLNYEETKEAFNTMKKEIVGGVHDDKQAVADEQNLNVSGEQFQTEKTQNKPKTPTP